MRIKTPHKTELKLAKTFKRIIGIDEVNVCSYFGEMIVVGVILPEKISTWACDSKLLSAKQIDIQAHILMKNVEYFVDRVTPNQCDTQMLNYEYDAIKRICNKALPDFVLIDYHSIPDKFHIPQWGVQGGDRVLWSVSTASILAKYIWNKKCKKYHKKYPKLEINYNKGALGSTFFNLTIEHGITPHHRISWLKSTCDKKGIDINKIPRY